MIATQWRGLLGVGCMGAAVLCVACGGPVVARSGDGVLTARRLERLFVASKARDAGAFCTGMVDGWSTYQGLGRAAAADDSLTDSIALAAALAPAMTAARLKAWLGRQAEAWVAAESGAYQGRYNRGEPLAARDVVFAGAGADSLRLSRQRAARFRATVTPATFETLAKQSHGTYENLGVFDAGRLAPALEQALRATRPGAFSAVVTTPYGSHVLYRPAFADVAAAVAAKDRPATIAERQRAYGALADSIGAAVFAPGAVDTVRAVARDPAAHARDSTLIASSPVHPLTVARLVSWLGVFPPGMTGAVAAAPDSLVRTFIRNIVGYEVFLRSADSAGVTVDSAARATMRRAYVTSLLAAWHALGVEPRTIAGRHARAAHAVDAYVDRLFAPGSRARPVGVSPAVERALAARYPATVDTVVLRALITRLARQRAVADSLHDARLPHSAVPMPGAH